MTARALVTASLLTFAVAAPVPALAQAVGTAKDLAAVIALQGKPCGTVVSFQKHGENDYTARCASGHVYRVAVDARGRVVVTDQK